MRNLKRALSLGLTAAMISGLMVMGSSAAGNYADVADTDNVEAIDVLQTINVMVGDGSNFNPDQNVTREEMAVIMCRLLDYTVSTYKGTTNFTDVDAWALPYVEACYTNGIIAGYSDTQFGGGDPVTTGQASLMILKALGYFQEPGDFGSDWLVETIRQGAQINLFDKVNNGANDALTRNDVAQIVLNALQAECVEISDHDLVSDGKGGFTTKANYHGRNAVTAWDTIEDADTGDGLQLGEELYEGKLALTEETDDMGRPSMLWKYNSQEIGLYPDTSELKATYTAKVEKDALYDLVGSNVVSSLKDDESDLVVWVNGEQVVKAVDNDAAGADALVETYFLRNSSGAAGATNDTTKTGQSGNGVVTEVYMDNEDNVTIVMTNTFLMKATSDYNETRELVTVETVNINSDAALPTLPATIEQDDFDVSGVKADDYLLVTYSISADALQTVEVAEILTGTVSEYTVTDNVYIDGTKYGYNKLTGTDEKSEEFSINAEASVVMDGYGNIIYVDEAVSTNSFVYIEEFGSTSSLGVRALARAYFADGSSKRST